MEFLSSVFQPIVDLMSSLVTRVPINSNGRLSSCSESYYPFNNLY